MPSHRMELSRIAVVLTVLIVFATGALASWAVGKVADRTVGLITDDGPIGTDVETSASMTMLLPKDRVKDLPAWSSPFDQWDGGRRTALAIGGVDGQTDITFYLFGKADTPVVVKAVDAVDVRCKKARGGWVGAMHEGGGAMPELVIGINLTATADTARGKALEDEEAPDWKFPRSVSRTEIEKFRATVQAPATSVCSYRLQVTYRHDGEVGRRLIDDHGAAFKIAGDKIVKPTLYY